MLTLDYITIKGYKSIAAIDKLQLRPINVIIGPNGSGKSNIIGAFSFLRAIRDGQLQNTVARAGGADRLLHFGAKVTSEMTFEVSFRQTNRFAITLQSTNLDELVPKQESAWFCAERYVRWTPRTLHPNGKEAGISKETQSEAIASHVRQWLERWRVYHFHDTGPSSAMKRTADINDNRYYKEDGGNLAAYLYLLQETYQNEFGLITRLIRRVAPFFDGFVLRPDARNGEKIRLEWRHTKSDGYFDVSSLSDGSLRFVALATLLLQPEQLRPSVILIDEPELGLHPYAITMLASLIKQAAVRTQVIVSTQSPFLLDQFEPEDVLVAERIEGGTTLRRLESEAISTWLEEYSLGQLWEKNEIGGRPKAE